MMGAAVAASAGAHAAATQTPQDRADPSVIADELKRKVEAAKPQPQPVAPPSGAGSETLLSRPVPVSAIRLEGAEALPAQAYAPVILPYKGRALTARQLEDLATAIAQVARNAGYGLASAWIPEQTVADGLLRVVIDEGRIDDLRVTGDGADAVRPFLAAVVTGAPVRIAALERALLLAGDLPGIGVGKPRIERDGGRAILVVRTSRDAARGRASLDNWGTGTVGPVRAQLSVDLTGFLSPDDRLTIGGVLTPIDIEEFGLVRLAYSDMLGTDGTQVTLSGYAARSRPGGILSDREFEGQSLEGSIALAHPFLRGRAFSLWGQAEFTVRDAEQSLEDVTVRKDRFAILKASTLATAELAGGLFRARIAASRGLGILDATRDGDPMRSRRDGSAIFSKLEFWADYDRDLGGPFSLQLQAEGQIASRPLLSSEEMGLGGRYFLRGYDYREFSGDKGVAGSVELRLDLPELGRPFRGAQLYGYADAGAVGNYGSGAGGGSLASAGVGIRAYLRPALDASLEIGVPLKDGADPTDGRDPRISFVIGSRF